MSGGSTGPTNRPDDGPPRSGRSTLRGLLVAEFLWIWMILVAGLPVLGIGILGNFSIWIRVPVAVLGAALIGFAVYRLVRAATAYPRVKEAALERDLGVR